jgi:tetratricopeptide (TPR) repeat protein
MSALLLICLLLAQAADSAAARARALIEAGKLKEAREALAGADPASSGIAYLRGLIGYRLHEYAEAAKALEIAAPGIPETSPRYLEAVQMIGRSEYLAGHVGAAIPWLEKARASGVHGNELFYMLGNSYLQTQQTEKARASFAALFGVPPDSGAASLLTAQMMLRQQLEDEAQQESERALERDPSLPGAHFVLGEIAIYRAQIGRAVAELNREIVLNPNFAMAYYRLGDAYTRREEWDRAISPLQRAIWLEPTYSGPYILLGKALWKTGDLPGAERMLRRALQMDPQNASAHYLLGRTLIQSGHAEEGKSLLRRSEELKQQSEK